MTLVLKYQTCITLVIASLCKDLNVNVNVNVNAFTSPTFITGARSSNGLNTNTNTRPFVLYDGKSTLVGSGNAEDDKDTDDADTLFFVEDNEATGTTTETVEADDDDATATADEIAAEETEDETVAETVNGDVEITNETEEEETDEEIENAQDLLDKEMMRRAIQMAQSRYVT